MLRSIYALPLRLGKLNITNPTASTRGYLDSIEFSNTLDIPDPIHFELAQNRLQKI